MSEQNKDEMIGFHKGALSTLSNEYNELAKILGIVQQLMQAHVKELEALGVKLNTPQEEKTTSSGWEKKPLEEELN